MADPVRLAKKERLRAARIAKVDDVEEPKTEVEKPTLEKPALVGLPLQHRDPIGIEILDSELNSATSESASDSESSIDCPGVDEVQKTKLRGLFFRSRNSLNISNPRLSFLNNK